MNKGTSIFQNIAIALFLVMGIMGIAFFASTQGKEGVGGGYKPIVWGVLPKSAIDEAMRPFVEKGTPDIFEYIQIPESELSYRVLNSIAEGYGPDAVIFPDDMFLSENNKLSLISYNTIPADTYKNTYIDAGNIFMNKDGVKALPIVIDPLVMYYNRDHFTSRGIINPPTTWKELSNMLPIMIKRQDNGVINRAFVALGEFSNINHAKSILISMLYQAGVSMTYFNNNTGKYTTDLANNFDATSGVIRYFTEFANPVKNSYSWNRSFTSSRDAFLAGDLSIYFGPGSEIEYMRSRNPNLNFAIAEIPQENADIRKRTHGKLYGLGFLRVSNNLGATYKVLASYFTNDNFINTLAYYTRLAPAKRQVLATSAYPKSDSDLNIVFRSAAYSINFIDPNSISTDNIFRYMIESITSGVATITETIQESAERIIRLYENY